MGGSTENPKGVVQFDLENLGIGKTSAEPAPCGSTVRGNIDTIVGSDVQHACYRIDLERPDRLAGKVAAYTRPRGASISCFENMTTDSKSANHRVGSRAPGGVDLDVLHWTGHGEITLCPSDAMVGTDKDVSGAKPIWMGGGVDRVRVRWREPDRVNKTSVWVPAIDSYVTDLRPSSAFVCCLPDFISAI